MRTLLAGAVIAGLWLPVTVFADTVDVPSQIVAVTVFPDRALVTRQASLTVEKGVHEVKISPLPGTIEEGSVTASGKGEAKVVLYGAKIVTKQLDTPQPPRVKELQEQIQQLNDRQQLLRVSQEILQQEREFLSSIRAASLEQIGKELITTHPSSAAVGELLTLMDKELTMIAQKSQQADIQLRDLAEAVDRATRELQQLQGTRWKQETAIIVELEAATGGRFTLEVSYRLPGATWQPLYEARATSNSSEVEMTTYGFIRQRTGEEWTDVTMTLSTAKPSVGGRMPELMPWWLRKHEPVVYDSRRGKGYELSALTQSAAGVGGMDRAEMQAPPQEEAELAQAVVETKGPSVTFTLPTAETIASDWQPRKSPIARHRLPARLAYETTPRLSTNAYLRAKTTNNTELVFLAGEVQVFLDGAFVSTSSIDVVGPTETFDLFLGIDERIRVERKTLKEKVDVSLIPGLQGRLKTIDYEYLTTLENFRGMPAEITVIDQLPVSQHDEIKIEQVGFEPKPAEQDQEKPGVYRWTFTLAPGAKQLLKLSYRVRHPVNFIIDGL